MMTFLGKDTSCPCINATAILASLPKRQCRLLPSGDTGIRLTVEGSCVPFSYGSSQCLQHDLLHEQNCEVDHAGEHIVPSYCFRPWCYVDFETCRKESDVRVFVSRYFDDSAVDLFFSYSTCNSTAEDWSEVEDDILGEKEALGGISITANVPTYQLPMIYKRDLDGKILASIGTEYYDDSVPFEGVYLKYIDEIIEISNGDIRNVDVTHVTRAAGLVHPTSSYTAAVQDINDGLIDMSIGPVWITAQRLKLSTFTLPIVNDKTVLVIPAPDKSNNFGYQITKVTMPFTWGLWGIVLGVIVFSALLSVWFKEDQIRIQNRTMTRNRQDQGIYRRRNKTAYARLALDDFLEKGLFFCSAGVEMHERSSLPVKVLLFGFGFFILIAVSSYVANLAGFLMMSDTSDAKTMVEAVRKGYTICAHPALKTEMLTNWPTANFYFHENAKEFPGMLEDYDAGKCRAMAVGREDTSMDTKFLQGMCKSGLVYTNSLIVETPIAFPIRSTIASGFSYWMYQGNRRGVTLEAAKESFSQDIGCNVDYTDPIGVDQDQISLSNMILPIFVFICCSAIAVIIQLIHIRHVREEGSSAVGRLSSLTTSMYIRTHQVERVDDPDQEEKKADGDNEGEKKADDDEEEEKLDDERINSPQEGVPLSAF